MHQAVGGLSLCQSMVQVCNAGDEAPQHLRLVCGACADGILQSLQLTCSSASLSPVRNNIAIDM